MTPATWEEMADPADEYMQVGRWVASMEGSALCDQHFSCWRAAGVRQTLKVPPPCPALPPLLCPQKGALWLFPKRCAPFDEGGAAEAAAAEPAGAAVAPFLPTPLRFLRRNKTAPVPASSPTSSSEGPPSGELGAAAVGGGGAGGWANVQVAGGTPRSVSSPKAAALHPTAPAAAAWAPQAGSVQRNFTWPVYQNPLALLPPSEPSGASLGAPAAQQVMLPLRAPAAAAPTPQVTRPSPPASQTSTPLDSAQDLEAGRAADQGGCRGGGLGCGRLSWCG